MSAPGSGPVDGLAFAYLKDVLIEARRPLKVGDIATQLRWDIDTARRIAGQAAEAGLLGVVDGRYSLTPRGAQR